jgi:hypothetical protein
LVQHGSRSAPVPPRRKKKAGKGRLGFRFSLAKGASSPTSAVCPAAPRERGGREKPPPPPPPAPPSPGVTPPPGLPRDDYRAFDLIDETTFQEGSIPRRTVAFVYEMGEGLGILFFGHIWMEVTGGVRFVASSPCSLGLSGYVPLVYQNRNFLTTFVFPLNFVVERFIFFPGVKTSDTRG